MICLEFDKLESKLKAMEYKQNFKGLNIWIDDDHTKREIEIQKWLRRVAKEERDYGYNAKVGYLRIIMDDGTWKFNETSAEFELLPFRERKAN